MIIMSNLSFGKIRTFILWSLGTGKASFTRVQQEDRNKTAVFAIFYSRKSHHHENDLFLKQASHASPSKTTTILWRIHF